MKVDILHPVSGEVVGFTYQDEVPALPYKVYTWGEFVERLQASGKARDVYQEMRKASNAAYDLEQFFDLGRTGGLVDFNKQFNRDALQALVPDIISQAALDNFMAAD